MDKQLIFFLILAFIFFINGTLSSSIIMQLSGIIIILFLIYNFYFNTERNKTPKKYYKTSNINFIQFLGNIDLTLGILLLIKISYGLIPHFLLSFIAVILLCKGLIFILGKDFASAIDIMSSLIIIYSNTIIFPKIVLILISIYLIQKGILSLFN